MPEITVAIPVYNEELYLEECIKSVTNQTFSDIQIILVNDGSIDRSGQICDEYAKKDPRISVYHKKNQGVSVARNFAINKASGEYICFVDSDDKVDRNMLEELYKLISNNKADIAICGHKTVSKNSKEETVLYHKPPIFKGSIHEFLEKIELFLDSESIQGPCGKLYKTKIIRDNEVKFPVELSFGEDTFFVYSYLKNCNRAISIDKSYYSYMKRHDDSLSSFIRDDKFEIYLKLYEELDDLLKRFNVNDKQKMIETKICTAAINCIGELYKRNSNLEFKERKRIIKNILFNENVIISFKDDSIQNKIINYAIQKNCISIIEVYFNVKETMRNRFSSIYELLNSKIK